MAYLPQNKLAEWREANKPERCPILGGRTQDWVVDHDHKTGMVRGVISRVGNSLLGKIENFLGSRCRTQPKDYPKVLRACADYLEMGVTDVLHPVGLKQLATRFKNNLTADEQIDLLVEMGDTIDDVLSLGNAKNRTKRFRDLTKTKHSNK